MKFRLYPLPIIAICAVLLACLLSLLSCGGQRKHNSRPVIYVTIEPLRYFTEQIAGPGYEVRSIVPQGYNPESYKPTAQQLMQFSEAQLCFKIGQLGFETTWLVQAAEEHPGMTIVDTSDSLRQAPSGQEISLNDPHTWTSPVYARVIAASICDRLCMTDSTRAPEFTERLGQLLQRIDSTDVEIHRILENIPSRTFITVHPSLTYFARDYGLTQLCIEQHGQEPTPADLQEVIRQSRQNNVRVMLLQKQFAEEQALMVAREAGAVIRDINPLGYDWPVQMINIAHALAQY